MKKTYYFAGLILLIISFFLDKILANFFVNNRLPLFDVLCIFIHNTEGYFLFAFVLILLFVFKQKDKIIPLLLTFMLYLGTTSIIKIIVARPRPFIEFDFSNLGAEDVNRSFPSGHATASASVIQFFEFKKILFYIWIGATILIMFSRVYLGMHYLSDVVAGLLLGLFVSDLSFFLMKKFKKDKSEDEI